MSQEYLSRNPLKANGLNKRKDDGNVKPAGIEAFQSFLKALDRKSYTGMCDYAIIVLMLDTGIRTKELLNLHTSDFEAKAGCIVVSKLVAYSLKILGQCAFAIRLECRNILCCRLPDAIFVH